MKLSFVISAVIILLCLAQWGGCANSCKSRSEGCRIITDCCPVMGRRMVCAPQLEICGAKKTCCITEVEEQMEKQAALLRNRNSKFKRFWNELYNDE